MQLFMIRRRDGWGSPPELEAAAQRSKEVAANAFPDDIRWIRSYVVDEGGGRLGTFCVYEASSEEKIREHAAEVGMPADDIHAVLDTVVVRPDPVPA